MVAKFVVKYVIEEVAGFSKKLKKAIDKKAKVLYSR